MRYAAPGRLGAVFVALAVAHCSSQPEVAVVVNGDTVRILSVAAADGCPSGWSAMAFDDLGWTPTYLPLGAVPSNAVCLRKRFDIVGDLSHFRWLKLRLPSHARAALNSGGVAGAGLSWSTDDDGSGGPSARDYAIDLRLFPDLLRQRGNVLAVQVAATTEPVDLAAALWRDDGSDSQFVRVVKGPYQVRPQATSTRIVWESDRSAPSWAMIDDRQYDGGWAVHHEVTVDNLAAGRLYTSYVQTAEASALPAECRQQPIVGKLIETYDDFGRYVERRGLCKRVAAAVRSDMRDLRAAATGERVRLAIVGETRADATMSRAILDAVAAESPDLVVHTGNVVAGAVEPDWQAFFDGARTLLLSAPIAPAPGELDVPTTGPDRFAQLFSVPTSARNYSVDVGPVHVALLDSTASLGDQAGWLDRDLAAATAAGARHLFVVVHWGPWSAGPAGGNDDARAAIVPIAQRWAVDAIVSGRDAIYEHGLGDGVSYFVSGGAGNFTDGVVTQPTTIVARALPHYLVVDVDGATATVRAKDARAAVFDQVTLARP